DAPADAELEGFPSASGLFSWWTALPPWERALVTTGIVLGAAVLFAAALSLYFSERARVGKFRRVVMACLRTLVVGIVLALLLLRNSSLLAVLRFERPRPIVVMVDNSQSMNLADIPGDPPKSEQVQRAFADPKLNLAAGLKKRGSVQAFLFARHSRAMAGSAADGLTPDALAEAFRPDAPASGQGSASAADRSARDGTALWDTVSEAIHAPGASRPGAIVLFSDGRDNASRLRSQDLALECRQLGVPLYIHGVGSAHGGFLQLRAARMPDYLVYDDTGRVSLRVYSQGFKKD